MKLVEFAICLLVLIFGAFMCSVGWEKLELQKTLEKSGVVTAGVVTGGYHQRKTDIGTLYVTFQPEGHSKVFQNFDVNMDFYEEHMEGIAVTHPQVTVRYLPTDPSKALLVGGERSWIVPFLLGCVACLGALSYLLYCLLDKCFGITEVFFQDLGRPT